MTHHLEVIVELYKRKDYSQLELFEKQFQALQYLRDDIVNETLYGGGSRGGKSWIGCKWQILNRLSMDESYGLIAREEFTKLRDTTMKTFFKVLKSLDLKKDVDYGFNSQTNIAEFKNGSHIFFREIKYQPSDPEFDRLGSYDLTDCFLDEAQQIDDKARNVLRGRLSVLSGEGWNVIPKALYTCNPRRNWIYNDFVKPFGDNTLELDKKFIKALPSDNPYTEKAYIDNLLKSDRVTVQRLVYGNFEYDDDPSLLVDFDSVSDLFTNTFINEVGQKHLSNDIAMQGRDKFISMLETGGVVRIKAEQAKSDGKGIEQIIKNIMNENQVSNSNVVVDSDGVGAYLSGYINDIKTFHGGSKTVGSTEYNNLKSQCGFKLAEMINAKKLHIICNEVQKERIRTEILACLKRDKLDIDDTKKRLISKDKMKQSLGHSPDYFDVLLMLMSYQLPTGSSILGIETF